MSDRAYLPPDLPIELDATVLASLGLYLDRLLAWNKVLNLSGFNDRAQIIRELIADSFYLVAFLKELFPAAASPLTVDLGAGAGLPGIPLRMVWQAGHYTMVEAREKRALFIANVLSQLKLPATSVFRGRAEKFFNTQKADCILSRAFMPWPKIASFCWPYLHANGILLIMANQAPPENMENWELLRQASYPVAGRERYFWALRKAIK